MNDSVIIDEKTAFDTDEGIGINDNIIKNDNILIPRRVIFVIDRSGSMSGIKWNKTIAATVVAIKQLRSGVDRFGIILFDNNIEILPYKDMRGCILTSDKNITDSINALKTVTTGGSTNINDSLLKAIELIKIDILLLNNDINCKYNFFINQMLFITDGEPNSGERDTNKIVMNVKNANNLNKIDKYNDKISIFSFGVGRNANDSEWIKDLNHSFLKILSLNNNGFYKRIKEINIDTAFENYFTILCKPILSNINIKYENKNISDLTNTKFNALYSGNDLIICGKIQNDSNNLSLLISAITGRQITNNKNNNKLFIKPINISKQITVNFNKNDMNNSERIWSYLTLQQFATQKLIFNDMIEIDNNEKKEEESLPLLLALKYQFITPWTSMIVVKKKDNIQPKKLPIINKETNKQQIKTNNNNNKSNLFASKGMIKKKKNKRKSTKGKGDTNNQTISLNDGWDRINKLGIQSFFDRIENVNDEDSFNKTSIPQQQYITAYDTLFTMCIQKDTNNYSSDLYNKHSETLIKQYKNKFIPPLIKVKNEPSFIFLKEWVDRWRYCKWTVDGMTRMFMYLDRFYVPNSNDLLNTSEQGYTLYKQYVFELFKKNVCNAILDCINKERNGYEQDTDLLRDSILVYIELGNKLKKFGLQIYKQDFHKELITQTKQYYKQKSILWLDKQSCSEYLIHVEKCIENEKRRLVLYLDKYSNNELITVTKNELLKYNQYKLLNKSNGINSMLEKIISVNDKTVRKDLNRLYRLYSCITDVNGKSSLYIIAEYIKVYIYNFGNNIIETYNDEVIGLLINLHDKFCQIIKNEFKSEPLFHKVLNEAFEEFTNKEYYISILLAHFTNNIVKKDIKISITDLEKMMDYIVIIYGYIRDKDIFQREYEQHLAHRLLQDLCKSEAYERLMINKFKAQICNYHWISKLQNMFKDIQQSKQLMIDFHMINNEKKYTDLECELNVSVCTTAAWPINSSTQIIKKPSNIKCLSDSFTQFYLSRFKDRDLNINMSKGKAYVCVQFNAKCEKILMVSTYQMLVLLLFNNKTIWTFKEIQDETCIPKQDLKVAILSMSHPKIQIMRKTPNTKHVEDNDKFQINPKYSNHRATISIPTLKWCKTKQNNKDMKTNYGLRRYQIDTTIVRVMKVRKSLKHTDLVSQVINQLRGRFNARVIGVEKRIAILIELKYLERDENDKQLYRYKIAT